MIMLWMPLPGMATGIERRWPKNRGKRLPWDIKKMTTKTANRWCTPGAPHIHVRGPKMVQR